jgi:hypothetical protein
LVGVAVVVASSVLLLSMACTQRPGTWATHAVPPKGQGALGASQARLEAVSCATPTSCLAIGRYQDGAVTKVLAETWDGIRWAPLPDLPIAGDDEPFFPDNEDAYPPAVDCGGPTACAVAINTWRGDAIDPALATWDGNRWTVHRPSPTADPAAQTRIDDVSCAGPNFCVATGTVVGDGSPYSFALRWDGQTWTATSPPRAPMPGPNPFLTFRSRVSCATPTNCVRLVIGVEATGPTGTPGNTRLATKVDRWDGDTWAQLLGLHPDLRLFDLDCTATNLCTAVGAWPVAAGFHPTAARLQGSSWSMHPLPLPADPLPQPQPYASWMGFRTTAVSCASASRCLALVHGATAQGREAVDLNWSGSVFSATATAPADPAGTKVSVEGLSCGGDGCTVVGRSVAVEGPTILPIGFRYQLRT